MPTVMIVIDDETAVAGAFQLNERVRRAIRATSTSARSRSSACAGRSRMPSGRSAGPPSR
jgi:hypothetical protein